MYLGIQTLPVIFVDNHSNVTINDITFWYDGLSSKEPKLKKIRSGQRKLVSLYTREMVGEKPLYMKHADNNNQIHKYGVFEQLNKNYWSNILVEITSVNEDGTLNIKATPNFNY